MIGLETGKQARRLKKFAALEEKKIREKYGFVADPGKTVWKNISEVLGSTSLKAYHNRIKTTGFHNLCTNLTPPEGIASLLGLGLKFCVQQRKLDDATLEKGLARMKRDVRLKYLFADEDDDFDADFTKKLYIKSNWQPPWANQKVEQMLEEFGDAMRDKREKKKKTLKGSTNLTALQSRHLDSLRRDHRFITLITDKNLGPAIMERDRYVRTFLEEHLLNEETYLQLEESDAKNSMGKTRKDLIDILSSEDGDCLTDADRIYFERGLKTSDRFPQMYGMPKVHKVGKTPFPYRPIESQCGSVFALASTFIDFHLQAFIPTCPAYLRDSDAFLKRVSGLKVPDTAILITSDATAMYTNIDPQDGIKTVEAYMRKYQHEITKNVPIYLVIKLLKLVMENNVFMFGSTYWKQLVGTAMGTPCAVNYTTLYFAWHERNTILPTFESNIIVYGRLVDDIGVLWDTAGRHSVEQFDHCLNTRCKLKWVTEKPAKSMDFLDLTVWIEEGTVWTKTFQKKMNLHLYITGNSAHPSGLTKGLICGLLDRYWKQNSFRSDFINTTSLLYERLLARGHKGTDIGPIFRWAASKIHNKANRLCDATTKVKRNSDVTNKNLFFHLEYHPKDISRQKIQDLYEKTCATPDDDKESFRNLLTAKETRMRISNLTVAYSRPKNLRDCLVQSRLVETSQHNVRTILHEINNSNGTSEEAAHG